MLDHMMEPLEILAMKECERAKAEHGHRYASEHEGYGVLAEEVQEAAEEMERVRELMGDLLRQVRYGSPMGVVLGEIRRHALQGAAECVQVAAVCDKMGAMR